MPGNDLVVIYTDGACSGNPGPGGWAWAVAPGGEPFGRGGADHTTNQRMEITAAWEAVQAFADDPRTILVRADSNYVVKCFTDNWWRNWIATGWKNSKREPVANRDLWEPFIEAVLGRGRVEFEWVKAHNGDPMNELVDQMAVAESLAR